MERTIRSPGLPILTVIALVLGPALPSAGVAQETGRTLGGHTFQPSGQVRTEPFITQHFETRTTGGLALGFKAPVVVGDRVELLEGDIGFLNLSAEYQHAFGEWLALRLRLGGAARVGTDGQALLAQGISTVYTGAFDATVKLWRWEKGMISAGLGFGSSQIYGVDIVGYVRDAIDNGELPPSDSLIASTEASSTRFSALGAWAPAPWLGFTAQLGFGYADVFDGEDRSDPLFLAGALADVDLGPLVGVPIGFTLGGDYNSVEQQGADVGTESWGATFGIHYTGRENLDLALEFNHRTLPLVSYDDDLVIDAVGFNVRYYWR